MQVNVNNPADANAQRVLNAQRPAAATPSTAANAEQPAMPFGQALSAVSEELKAKAEKQAQEVRGAAEQLVATTFIMPLFSQLRNDPMASDMFHGGRGEAIFQQQLDQIMSDRISTGAGFDLVDTVAAYFAGQAKTSADTSNLMEAARSREPYKPVMSEGVDLHG